MPRRCREATSQEIGDQGPQKSQENHSLPSNGEDNQNEENNLQGQQNNKDIGKLC